MTSPFKLLSGASLVLAVSRQQTQGRSAISYGPENWYWTWKEKSHKLIAIS